MSQETKIGRRFRWDAFLAAYPGVMILREFSSGPWETALAYGVVGGGGYYAYIAACDRFGWQRGTKAAVIGGLYLVAIVTVAALQ